MRWVLLLLWLMAGPASAQPPDADSVRTLKAARWAQSAFEYLRRRSLPTMAGGPGRCDEQVGRLCYWYDEGGKLPEEPRVIRQGRTRLLAELAAAARERPSDDWIMGQWVRYLVEQKETDSAVAAAASCRGTPWWCGALEGLALHTGERFAEASQSFDRALSRMPAGQACRWLDLGKLLEDGLAAGYQATPCEARAGLTDTLLWLSQPLLSREGNDLRTELLARRAMIVLLDDAAQWTHEMAWGGDAAEILLRYGWEVSFAQRERAYPTQEPGTVVGYERFPAYAFFPRRVLRDSGGPSWRWSLHPDRPRSRYAPTYAASFTEITGGQVARFRRGDSTVVVVGFDLGGDTAFAGGRFEAALALSRDPATPLAVSRASLDRPGGALLARAPWAAAVASLEVEAPKARRFARWRAPLQTDPESTVVHVSDLLLFAVGENLPAGLEEAAARALPGERVSRRRPVGIYWEASGPGTDSLEVAVSVVPYRRGLLGRIGQSLTFVGKRAPLTLEWRANAEASPVVARAFELDLRRLRPGKYRLRLEAAAPSGWRQAATRDIEVTDATEGPPPKE